MGNCTMVTQFSQFWFVQNMYIVKANFHTYLMQISTILRESTFSNDYSHGKCALTTLDLPENFAKYVRVKKKKNLGPIFHISKPG